MTTAFERDDRCNWIAGTLLAMLLASVSLGRAMGQAAESPAPAKRVLALYSGERLLPTGIVADETYVK